MQIYYNRYQNSAMLTKQWYNKMELKLNQVVHSTVFIPWTLGKENDEKTIVWRDR